MTNEWQPNAEILVDTVTEASAAALHGLLDAPGDPPAAGDPLPPLWHWMAFLPRVPQRVIGADGHPRVGSFMPPQALGRRMFAGAQMRFGPPLPVGAPLRRHAIVTAIDEKSGRTGPLLFVTVEHTITAVDADAGDTSGLTEVQNIVYRQPAPPGAAGDAAAPPPAEAWEWEWSLAIDPVVLFRYSALTYNGHRIHYDYPYVTEVEGYPGLVVHGPLQATALAEIARRHFPGRPLKEFRYRAQSPAFGGPDQTMRFCGRPNPDADNELILAAIDDHGQTTMSAVAVLA